MSTFKEIIARVNETKPNAFSEATKLSWLTSLNGKLAVDIFLMDIAEVRALPQGADALDCEPLVGFPHEEVYEEYLAAKIDAANGEASEYQNRMQIYDAYYGNFVEWFKSTYDPIQGDPNCHGIQPKLPTYYITAYGMAVMCGYRGTLEQWIASLKGEPGVSPTVTVVAIEGGHRVTFADVNGEMRFDVMDGAGAVSSVCGMLPDENGDVPLTHEKVGAAKSDHKHTAKDVDAAEAGHTHTASDIGAQERHISRVVTLLASDWAENAQTVAVEGVSANNTLIVASAPENYDVYSKAGVYCAAQAAGELIFKCNSAPAADLNANVMILN